MKEIGTYVLIGVNGGDNITRNPNKDLIRKKLSLSRKGRVFSKETKLKISLARKKYFEVLSSHLVHSKLSHSIKFY